MLNNNSRAAVLAAGLAAVFVLYFFGKTVPTAVKEAVETTAHENHDHEMVDDDKLIFNSSATLLEDEKAVLEATTTTKEKSAVWLNLERYEIAALLAEDYAEEADNEEDWNHAGDLFVRAYRSVKDSTLSPYFLEKGVNAYKMALEKAPNNITRLKLAKIYTDIYGLTMEGVLLLREIVENNPNHVQANFELGVLSVKSGQLDKALERFNKVLKVEPTVIQAYTWKAQVLLEQKKNGEAVAVLEEGVKIAPDEKTKAGLQDIIKEIVINN